jgi:hypothetical protein
VISTSSAQEAQDRTGHQLTGEAGEPWGKKTKGSGTGVEGNGIDTTRPPSLENTRNSEFAYDHLPERLHHLCRPFHDLAEHLARMLGAEPGSNEVLQKLLETRNAALEIALSAKTPT